MKSFPLSIDEIIETLKRSNLPTVLTEGKDDYSVFRFVEDEFDVLQVSVMPVGGKSILLELMQRRHELPRQPLFVIDQDLWAIFGAPDTIESQEGVILTTGFSIENDMFIDGSLHSLLSRTEKENFDREIRELCRWFACMLEHIQRGKIVNLRTNPHQILGSPTRTMSEEFKLKVEFHEPDAEFTAKIYKNYPSLMRGKTLLALLAQHLSRPRRVAKHSFASLLEIGSIAKGPLIGRVLKGIECYLQDRSI